VPAYGPQNDVTLKMPAFEWVHVQLHQQKGMISLSPPTICNSAAIFKLKKNVDAFDEVISSYYQTYQFIRDEMKLLNPKKDNELYNISNDMLMVLNKFLTKNQNNYKRWYKYISDKDEVIDVITNTPLKVHLTPINKIQKQYYNYSKICNDFKVVNDFFTSRVQQTFNVNTTKWDW
ncbi:hypothetical protein, partial [Citrobacter freundii]|uniref:hypothetical protein n=1 Tax=Citrobacter freundii TaxID=546 RepID=UPI00374F3380